MKKLNINKKNLTLKGILAAVLAAIMLILILGYLATRNMKPRKDLTVKKQQPEETQSAVQTENVQEEPTQENQSAEEESTVPPEDVPQPEKSPIEGKTPLVTEPDSEYWQLAIISVDHPLAADYVPKLAPAVSGSNIEVDSRISPYYQKMYDAAKQDGCILTPYSGYLSYSHQESTYTRQVNYYLSQGMSQQEAELKAQKKTQPAGCSEHNAGLAVDIGSASFDFENTREFNWLCQHAHEYGFIMRYPKDKEYITGLNYQPWHWRFVGEENAGIMKQSDKCLEEYLGLDLD